MVDRLLLRDLDISDQEINTTLEQAFGADQELSSYDSEFEHIAENYGENKLIRAKVVAYADYVANNGIAGARDKGVFFEKGKDYVVQDGDVMDFRFNV